VRRTAADPVNGERDACLRIRATLELLLRTIAVHVKPVIFKHLLSEHRSDGTDEHQSRSP
jgi:hypothetical protein